MSYQPKGEYHGYFEIDIIKNWDCQKQVIPTVRQYGYVHVLRALRESSNQTANSCKDRGGYGGEAHYHTLSCRIGELVAFELQHHRNV